LKNHFNARVTIGTLHRVADTKPVIVTPADMVVRDTEVVRSINLIVHGIAVRRPEPGTVDHPQP
jgi:hypothetical protein